MLKILIVEDEDIIRKGLVHTIDWLAMEVSVVGEACNGEEGLEKIQYLCPDVVITDIKMPKRNGIEMLEAAKEICDFKSIILTSFSEFEYAKQAITLQVVDYLLKPVDEEVLVKIIEKIKGEILHREAYKHILGKAKDKQEVALVDVDVYITMKDTINPYVKEALKQIKENYSDKISIDTISNDMGVSASYLSRKFKDTTSNTFLDFLHKYRIQKAVELLNQGTYKVYEISDLTGFSEYKHFCSVFKKYIGAAPTEFIKEKGYIMQKGNK